MVETFREVALAADFSCISDMVGLTRSLVQRASKGILLDGLSFLGRSGYAFGNTLGICHACQPLLFQEVTMYQPRPDRVRSGIFSCSDTVSTILQLPVPFSSISGWKWRCFRKTPFWYCAMGGINQKAWPCQWMISFPVEIILMTITKIGLCPGLQKLWHESAVIATYPDHEKYQDHDSA